MTGLLGAVEVVGWTSLLRRAIAINRSEGSSQLVLCITLPDKSDTGQNMCLACYIPMSSWGLLVVCSSRGVLQYEGVNKASVNFGVPEVP
ncbi:hypothetical protein F5J12DRAFT_854510 [Pisolithus orientalis]|uniref:uncharacterized protein n=1 Tax=Pisolithus orientalis TaxID=936130 RepID=UPI00222490B2|nr:uncharacterized protein F5J12DRAFT_854510 [Pisolithus orientalis]KAI5995997.1 hypothetical protein F5J12DRAFT_854510 [Pisolithus orientalis]